MTQTAETRKLPSAAQREEAAFNWEDPLDLESELSEEERMVRDTARGYAQDKLFPRVLMDNREERFDRAIISEMGALGLLGPTIPEEYGGAGLGYVAYGLITREIERVLSGAMPAKLRCSHSAPGNARARDIEAAEGARKSAGLWQ